MRQFGYTLFLNNNRTSFHLWWKENLVKYQKVSKYYENDCRSETWEEKLWILNDWAYHMLSNAAQKFFNPNLDVGYNLPLPLPNWFSLNNSETVKAVPWHFAAFTNISLETFLSNLISLTHPVSRYCAKLWWGYFRFTDFWSIPYKRKLP